MTLIETSVFTRRVQELLEDDEYADLQFGLAENPELGDVIPGCGGIRKVRRGINLRAEVRAEECG